MATAMRPRDAWPGRTLVWGTVAAAWCLALTLSLLGHDDLVSHDAVLDESPLTRPGQFVLFLVAWQLMTAAMMLPSSLPAVRLFARASRWQARPRLALAAFLAAYFAVWMAFAVVALSGDAGLHAVVDRWRWLDERPWLISGSVLLMAAAFQFSPLKERCLHACRNPMGFLRRHYGRGTGAAWSLGLRHGIFCLGCCWALMLVMFAVGVRSLAWMTGFAGVMLIEKTSPRGRRLVPVVGAALLLWGMLALLRPGWLPSSMGGR